MEDKNRISRVSFIWKGREVLSFLDAVPTFGYAEFLKENGWNPKNVKSGHYICKQINGSDCIMTAQWIDYEDLIEEGPLNIDQAIKHIKENLENNCI